LGFPDKEFLPKVPQNEEFKLKTFFARFYASQQKGKTDGFSKFSEAFIKNFDK
jgi:hypothetical protein